MSLLHQTDVYQASNEKAEGKLSSYGFVLVLVCMALALVVASVIFTPAPVATELYSSVLNAPMWTSRDEGPTTDSKAADGVPVRGGFALSAFARGD
jgi:hypothetical protein